MKLKSKQLFSLLYVAFFAGVIFLSTGYNSKARLIPLVVAIPCLLFSIAQFFFDAAGKEKKKSRSIEDDLFHGIMDKVHLEIPGAGSKPEKKKRDRNLKPFFAIVAWILGFYVLVYLLGFMITIPLYTVVFMRAHGERWFVATASAAGTWAVIYVAFSLIAKIALHEGLVFTLLSQQ